MARLTRKELKTDKFALEVEHTVDFFEEHRKEIIRYGIVAAVVLVVLVAAWFYRRQAHATREQALANAIQIQEAPVGSAAAPGTPVSFPTQQAKDQAATAAFTGLANKYSGSDEGAVAEYYLGAIAADQGKLSDAARHFQQVADSGSKNYASLAKLSLAQIDFATGRAAQGEQLLRWLMDHPTDFVSRDQAAVLLAKQLAPTNPAEARKLIDPLRGSHDSSVSQIAIDLSAQLSPH